MSRITTTITTTTLPKNFFSAFKRQAQIAATKLTEEAAKQAASDAREIIKKQIYKWKPLSEGYLKYKKRKGLDHRIYVATKDYLKNGIGWWKRGDHVFVGPKMGLHKPSGLTYYILARILEFGTTFIPARPLWRPLMAITLRRNRVLQQKYYAAMREALMKRTRIDVKTINL